jgi:hypothetical protein
MNGQRHLSLLAESDDLSATDAVTGILRFVIAKMADDPEGVSVAQAAAALEGAARCLKELGTKSDGGLAAFVASLNEPTA